MSEDDNCPYCNSSKAEELYAYLDEDNVEWMVNVCNSCGEKWDDNTGFVVGDKQ